jgi:hypothetical protein
MKRLLIPLIALITLSVSSLADEQIRRIQEELRKRNLYFGEIDGQKTEETVRALRHYQERKGFKPTGEPDEDTWNALNLGAANAPVAAGPKGGEPPWPDVPILKSDAARKIREEDRKYLESLNSNTEPPPLPLSPAPLTKDGSGPPTSQPPPAASEKKPQPESQPPTPVPSPKQPPSRPAEDVSKAGLPPERAENFVQGYLDACETNHLSDETAYYADRVKYFDHGTVDRNFIERDVSAFYRRWPERKYRLLDVKVLHSSEDESLVRFRIAFHYRSPEHVVSGKTDNFFTIQQTRAGMKFTSMREQRLRD